MLSRLQVAVLRLALTASACGIGHDALAQAKHLAPIPAATLSLLAARDTTPGAPILIRAYKKEAEMEVWKRARSGRYVHVKTFPICRWSGQLGPKRTQGDRQTPEGFYAIAPRQMNPNSAYYLSFDLGYPNAYDRAHGGSGSYLMVHGTCSSAGCFAMTDKAVGEIYALAREAFAGGQGAFQFQSFPFRMTALNMARHRSDPNIHFWRQLKEGSDRFEATGEEPVVSVAAGRYAFAPSRDPAREALATQRLAQEQTRIAALVEDGSAAVRTTYSDGGQHPTFAALLKQGAYLGDVSRPEALAFAGREIVVIPARPKRPPVQVARLPRPVTAVSPQAAAQTFGKSSPAPLFAQEPSLFAWTALGVLPRAAVPASVAGAMRILPPVLAQPTFDIARS